MLRMDVNGTSVCIGANSGLEWQDVKTFPCSTKQENLWLLDSKGRIKSSRFPKHCLYPSGVVDGVYTQIRLEYCWRGPKKQSWFFTSKGEIRFSGSNLMIQVRRIATNENLYLGPRVKEEEKIIGYMNWKKLSLNEARLLY